MNEQSDISQPKTDAAAPATVPAPAAKSDPITPEQQLQQVSALLRGGDSAPGDAAGAAAGDPGVPSDLDPLSVEGLAQALKRDPADLYALKIPTRDGETVTLGELKDYHAKQAEHALGALEWEERRTLDQAELTRARAELADLLSAVPRDKLNPEVLQRVRAQHDKRLQVEQQRTLDRIPEWKNDERRAEDLAGMREYLADYGLPGHALNEIQDHRMIALIRDSWSRKVRLEQALAQVREVRTQTTGASTRTTRPKSPGSTRSGPQKDHQRKLAQVSKLLSGE